MSRLFSERNFPSGPDWWAVAGIALCSAALALLAVVSAGCASAPRPRAEVRTVTLIEFTMEIDGRVTHRGRTWSYDDEAPCPVPVPAVR